MLSLISKKLSKVLKVIGGVLVAGALVSLGIFAEKKNHEKKVDRKLPNIVNSIKAEKREQETMHLEATGSENDRGNKDENSNNGPILIENENTNSSTAQVNQETKTISSSKDINLLKSVIVNIWDKKENLERERDMYKNVINGFTVAQQYIIAQEQRKK